MPYYQTWEEFARAAEKLYLTDPMKVTDKQPFIFRLPASSTYFTVKKKLKLGQIYCRANLNCCL